MYYTPQILLYCLVWINAFKYSVAKEPLDPELLKKFTKDVETVLSPTLIEELQGAQSNRSAINVAQTIQRNQGPSRIIDNRKPEIRFDNNVYPYHYERSYHYHYPPSPQDGSSGPVTYSENFYEPRFGPRNQPVDNRDPSYYRSELYNPFDSSSTTNVNSYTNFDVHGNSNLNDKQREENPAAGNQGIQISKSHSPNQILDGLTPSPPPSFVPSHPNPFPDRDYDGYRHGSFGGPIGTSNHFISGGDTNQRQNDPHSRYLPQGEGRFSESFHRRPVESYRNFPPLQFHGYNEHRTHSPESSLHRSQYLPPKFLGSFFPPGYQNHFQNNYHPSEAFNGLFSENFTREFPSKPSSGGFYPSHDNYLPPSTPSASSISPALPASKSEDPVPLGDHSIQPIPTTKPADQAPSPLASNFNYDTKLFLPAKDDDSYNLQTNRPQKLSSKSFK